MSLFLPNLVVTFIHSLNISIEPEIVRVYPE